MNCPFNIQYISATATTNAHVYTDRIIIVTLIVYALYIPVHTQHSVCLYTEKPLNIQNPQAMNEIKLAYYASVFKTDYGVHRLEAGLAWLFMVMI